MFDIRLYNTLINNLPETDGEKCKRAEGEFTYFLENGSLFRIKCLTDNYKNAYALSRLSVNNQLCALIYVDTTPTSRNIKRVSIDGVHNLTDEFEEEEQNE